MHIPLKCTYRKSGRSVGHDQADICRRISGQTPQTPPEDGGSGERLLVDRAWPDGVRRQGPPFDEWLRDGPAPAHGATLGSAVCNLGITPGAYRARSRTADVRSP
ncbi:DUF488 family protein, N3 subclade [Streptomyces sp. NPDC054770]